MFLYLPLNFNAKCKCNCEGGNSKFVALRSKKTLLMMIMSASMLDLGCFVNFKIFFVQIVHLWYHHFQDCIHDCCVRKLHHLMQLVQGTNLFNNWIIANVQMKHLENFHDMLANNALCYKGAIALWPFWSWSMYNPYFSQVIGGCHKCNVVLV
jgi:hypothetical protein